MKKILITAILVITASFLIACNGNTGSDGNTVPGGETEVVINPGEWQLSGTLTLPDGDGPFPVVVFVHGSGPADRDETIGKHKVFKNLAADLKAQGIASLRYDKRTYLYGSKMTDVNLTVYEETIDDIFHAVELLSTSEKIDVNNIYIVGHSMGGYLIPRIYEADTNSSIAGYVSLAGSVRSITELTIEQIDYLLSLDTTSSEADKAAYRKQITDLINVIDNLTEKDRGTSTGLLGAYPTYWLDLKDYKPDIEAQKIQKPMLFLQGEHDYQVTMTDFNLWKTALKDNPNAEFISYPDLTHSFTKTAAMSTPDDYQVYAEVDKSVAADIADFILKK